MLPSRPGTYVLILDLPQRTAVDVGQLGRFQFPCGWFTYVGSARGPGGLAARIHRHLRSPKPMHWHLDYLRPYARLVEVWYAEGDERRECAWAAALEQRPGVSLPVPGFGASDCHCPSHLLHSAARPHLADFARATGVALGRKMVRDLNRRTPHV